MNDERTNVASTPVRRDLCVLAMLVLVPLACAEPEGLMRAEPAEVTVKFDFDARPLPDIPLPGIPDPLPLRSTLK